MPIQAFSSFLIRLYKDYIVLIFTGILLLSGSQALALEITAVGLGNDAFEGQLMIMGSGFDTGITPPMVYIDEYPYPLSVIAYDSNQITAVFSLLSLHDYLDPSTEDALTLNLTVVIHSNETIEYEGAEIVVPKTETAEYCFDIETDGTIVACGEGTGPLVPLTRQVDWRLPNDPEGNICVDYAYKFGPVKINSSDNKRGDPVYYQTLHDYKINLKQYLEDYDKNNFGDTLLDRCEDALDPLLERLEDLAYKGWPDTNPAGDLIPFMAFGNDGTLFIKKGYRWDGPTLDFAGSRILAKPSSLIRASMVHDAIYDLMRMHLIEHDWLRVAYSK